jgi:hypothetical protein
LNTRHVYGDLFSRGAKSTPVIERFTIKDSLVFHTDNDPIKITESPKHCSEPISIYLFSIIFYINSQLTDINVDEFDVKQLKYYGNLFHSLYPEDSCIFTCPLVDVSYVEFIDSLESKDGSVLFSLAFEGDSITTTFVPPK